MKFRFDPELIRTNMKVKDKTEAIKMLAQVLIEQRYVDQKYPTLVLEREAEYPTGLVTKGAVIAIPHSFAEDIAGNHIAIGVLQHPVSFQNMEDIEQCIPVKIIFMLAIGSAHKQLEMLQVLMQMFKEEQLLKQISMEVSVKKICHQLNTYIDSI